MMGLWTMALPGAQVVTGPFAGWVTQDVGPREGRVVVGDGEGAGRAGEFKLGVGGEPLEDDGLEGAGGDVEVDGDSVRLSITRQTEAR